MPQGCLPKETSSAPFHTGTHLHTIRPKTVPNQDDTQHKISRIHSAASFALPRVCDYLMHCFREIPSDTLEFVRYQPWSRAIFTNLLLRLLNRCTHIAAMNFYTKGSKSARVCCSSLFCACCHFDRPQYDYEQNDKKNLVFDWFCCCLDSFSCSAGISIFHTYFLRRGITLATHLWETHLCRKNYEENLTNLGNELSSEGKITMHYCLNIFLPN